MSIRYLVAGCVVAAAASAAFAQSAGDIGSATPERLEGVLPQRAYSPYADRHFPERPLFGDTHLHTAVSFDAGMFGARLTPADAFRFAKGEQVTSNTGQPVRLSRPLDFLVIADHSDNMGLAPDLISGAPNVLAVPEGNRWYGLMQEGKGGQATVEMIQAFSKQVFPEGLKYLPGTKAYSNAWEASIKAADDANEPGTFTAFIGYEWTTQPNGNNMHRNVIYRDGGAFARQTEPMTAELPLGSPDPRDLWKWMENYEAKTGGDVLAIAHNGNLSNGVMFPVIESFTGEPIDLAYAEARTRWEPLYEVTQMKGDGETHPFLSPTDEFANFEIWDKANLDASTPKTNDMLQFEYARSALKTGLQQEARLGVNPYKFGMIGSTDAHTGLAAVEENNFFGKVAGAEPSAGRLSEAFFKGAAATIMEWEVASGAYAAVWAKENTRASIFDAMERRETYSTTGPRMFVRFFGGWDFESTDANTRTPSETGYTRGVPMGADLPAGPDGTAPRFLVAALRDPIGANLDRIQIVKGWVDSAGETQEKVYDVVWSDNRAVGADGKLPPVGNTVDVANATWANTIGAPELITVWEDPDFDPAKRAFYYARVLEIPTPRWTAYDAKYFGETNVDPNIPMWLQERAVTSPIWYTPEG